MNTTNKLGPHAPETQRVLDEALLTSVPAPSETAGPAGSLRCDGVVGLRAESAEAHWLMLHAEAKACEELAERNHSDYDRGWNHGMAQAYRLRANWLQEICRQAGYPIPRQPEPNIAGHTPKEPSGSGGCV